MSDVINVRKNVSSLEKQNTFDGYSKVTISVSDEMEYSAGTDTGQTLRLFCPWGTQEMANKILSNVRGFQYQPYTASGAHINPAVELGDAFSAGSVYGGIYKKDVLHGPLYTANISAPGGEKINYKYEYKSPTIRKAERQYKETKANLIVVSNRISAEVEAREADTGTLRAALNVQAQEISAKVSRTGGDAANFGWSLTADGWTLTSGGSAVLKADKYGLQVSGRVTATAGKIGGFSIEDGYLSTNRQTWGGTNTTGIYIGSSGIQLGKNFSVDAAGNLTAHSGTFLGTVSAGNIEYGGSDGYFNASGLLDMSIFNDKIATDAIANRNLRSASIYPSTCNSTINGYFADVIYANKVVTGQVQSEKLWTNRMYAAIAEISSLIVSGNAFTINGDRYMTMKKDAATYVIGRA